MMILKFQDTRKLMDSKDICWIFQKDEEYQFGTVLHSILIVYRWFTNIQDLYVSAKTR